MERNSGSFTRYYSYLRERKVVSSQDTPTHTRIKGLLSSRPVTNRKIYAHFFGVSCRVFMLALQNLLMALLLLHTKQLNCGRRYKRND